MHSFHHFNVLSNPPDASSDTKKERIAVPLLGLNLTGTVTDKVVNLTLSQLYTNEEIGDIEAVYIFPMHPKASIIGLQIETDDKTINADLQEREKARDTYDDAIASGHSAFLLERSSQSKDVYSMNVGRLTPHAKCKVTIRFAMELECINPELYRLTIPSVITPRYGGLHTNSSVCENFTIDINSAMLEEIKHVECSELSLKPQWATNRWNVHGTINAFRDIHISISILPSSEIKITSILEKGKPVVENTNNNNNSLYEYAALFVVKPDSSIIDGKPSSVDESEYVFLVDCSGSMAHDDKMTHTKTALRLFIRSLPLGVYFNIIKFGTGSDSLFTKSEKNDNHTAFQLALGFIDKMSANMGGTELYRVFTGLPLTEKRRSIILLTDGEVNDTEKTIEAARQLRNTRIFTIGLGNSPSIALVQGVAEATSGKYEFVVQAEDVHGVTMRHLERASLPHLSDIKFSLEGLNFTESLVPKFLFSNERNAFYSIFTAPENFSSHLQLTSGQQVICTSTLSSNQVQTATNGSLMALAGHNIINNLEMDEKSTNDPEKREAIKKEIIRFSLSAKVACGYTSFVAVEKKNTPGTDGMVLRNVIQQMKPQETLAEKFFFGAAYSLASSNLVTKGESRGSSFLSAPFSQSHNNSSFGNSNIVNNCFSCDSGSEEDMEEETIEDTDMDFSYQSKPFSFQSKTLPVTKLKTTRRYGRECESAHERTSDSSGQDKCRNAENNLISILNLQNWNGSWDESKALFNELGMTRQKVESDIGYMFGNSKINQETLTAFILIFLYKNFKSSQTLWNAIFKKGITFLKNSKEFYPSIVSQIENESYTY
jgi:hypothetical protein